MARAAVAVVWAAADKAAWEAAAVEVNYNLNSYLFMLRIN
jgi:hypothetical protein